MTAVRDELTLERSERLDERVLSTLLGLQGRIAFSGLRRVLHAHPESLSRSLRRLEREGRIERSNEGYRAVSGLTSPPTPDSSGLRSIAAVDLPPGTVATSVLGRLSGRWFGSLRWVGIVGGPKGGLLAWARRDGAGYVLLGIDRGVLRVYVRDEDSGDDEAEAEDSAYELLSHAVGALRPSSHGTGDSVSFFAQDAALSDRFLDN